MRNVMQEFDNQEKLKELLQNQLDQNLYRLIISNSNGKNNYKKILVRPIMQKGILIFQHAIHTDKQVFHKNLEKDESIKEILDEMGSNFMQ